MKLANILTSSSSFFMKVKNVVLRLRMFQVRSSLRMMSLICGMQFFVQAMSLSVAAGFDAHLCECNK